MTEQLTTAQGLFDASADWPWWLSMLAALLLVAAAAGLTVLSRRADYADGTMSPSGCLIALVAVVLASAGLALLGYSFIS
jgi:hypothetical protein